ncbi:MAG: GntR family transcriptional regulator [Phenylobacterium sp.]
MSPGRVEPFQRALTELRERLRLGALTPGARVTAKEVAEELRLSATPVREALSRLAGEGLLEERRGDGFFVRTLSALDIADLYRMSQAILALAQDQERRGRPDLAQAAAELAAVDPVRAVERIFAAWVAEAGRPVLATSYRLLAYQVGAVRRAEHRLLADLVSEARSLAALAAAGGWRARQAALTAFHDRRIALADELATLFEADPAAEV